MECKDMNNGALKRVSWSLTQEGFDKFLLCLHTDTTQAGEIYEKMRSKLISFFEWRGFSYSEDHADEVMDRVIRKIDEGEAIREVSTYVYGVARMVVLELVKERDKQNAALNNLLPVARREEADETMQGKVECLQRCLQTLSEENRELILGYYEDDKGAKIEHRRLLASRLQIPLNALRIRALRLRDKLENCITKCQQQKMRGRPNSGENLYRLEKRWN